MAVVLLLVVVLIVNALATCRVYQALICLFAATMI